MITIKIIFLATLQGITEFLPISSSGHLSICQHILGIKDESSLLLAVLLHAGTLLAIIIYYFKELLSLLKRKNHRIILLLIIGTIPAGIIGVLIKKTGIEDRIFTNMIIPGVGLLITGSLLKWGMTKQEGSKTINELSLIQAFTVGLFQSIAVFPGISRSGSTIIGSVSQKLKRAEAATFSFLLAIPLIGGAAFVEAITSLKSSHSIEQQFPIGALIAGFIISAVVGYFALRILLRSLEKGNLMGYAYYCFSLGTVVLIWQLIKFCLV